MTRQETWWKSFQVDCEHSSRMCSFLNIPIFFFFSSHSPADMLWGPKKPHPKKSLLFLRQLILMVLLRDSLSKLLLLLLCCSHPPCPFSALLLIWFCCRLVWGLSFLLAYCSLPAIRWALVETVVGVKDGRGWTLLSCSFSKTVQADLKSSIYCNAGCELKSLGS